MRQAEGFAIRARPEDLPDPREIAERVRELDCSLDACFAEPPTLRLVRLPPAGRAA